MALKKGKAVNRKAVRDALKACERHINKNYEMGNLCSSMPARVEELRQTKGDRLVCELSKQRLHACSLRNQNEFEGMVVEQPNCKQLSISCQMGFRSRPEMKIEGSPMEFNRFSSFQIEVGWI